MKRIVALLLALALCVTVAGCTKSGADINAKSLEESVPDKKSVGIFLPEDTQQWGQEGQELMAGLEKMDCRAVLSYAQNDSTAQAQQIQKMIDKKVDCLVVAAVDAFMLTDVLQVAKNAGIPVIAYDRLLMNTDAVSCYVGFDDGSAGVQMGQYIVDAKQLETAQAQERSYTIELFMGSPEDNNALVLYQGIMDVLQPYFESGVLECKTGRTAFEDVCTKNWSADEAEADCAQYIAEFYQEALPDILCAASDSLAQGCANALDAVEASAESWPLIIGQGADADAIQRIAAGRQTASAYRDRTMLVENCLTAVETVLSGKPLTYMSTIIHNGAIDIPAFLSVPVTVDAWNCQQVCKITE